LVEWNNSNTDTVKIRLTKDTTPWFQDYIIPSKKSLYDLNSLGMTITDPISGGCFAIDSKLDTTFYGGSRQYINATFDATTAIDGTLDTITLSDYSNFNNSDAVKFYSPTNTNITSTGLNTTAKYYIRNEPSDDTFIQVSTSLGGSVLNLTDTTGLGDIQIIKYNEYPAISTSDPGDVVTFRYTVTNSGNANWATYFYPITYTWASGTSYRFGNIVVYNSVMYKCIFDVVNSTVNPSTDTANFKVLITNWVENTQFYANDIVIKDGSLYIALVDANDAISPSVNPSYQLFAPAWVNTSAYNKGSYVYYNGFTYVSKTDITTSLTNPSLDTERWEKILLFKVPTSATFNSSTIARWALNQDVAGFVIRNINVSSTVDTNISLRVSSRTKEPASIYQRSVDSFPSSNFGMWPDTSSSVWNSGETYGPTDESIDINKRQAYSASMVFDHTT